MIDAFSEAQAVTKSFPQTRVLSGAEATLPAILSQLGGAQVFHFCGHGISNSDDGALVLAPASPAEEGAQLTAPLLSGQAMNHCRLAVLSACSSGVGENRGPVNPKSLVNAFIRAGVEDVIASRWRIDSFTTAQFMEAFYGSLRAGRSVREAMRLAGGEIRANPATRHPYYWAAFSVFGE